MYASVSSSFNFSGFSLFFVKSALVLILLLANAVAVFALDGEVDLSYAPSLLHAGIGVVIEQQPDGKMLVGGQFPNVNGVLQPAWVIRINADGTVDQSFSAFPQTGEVRQLRVQPDGKILVGGSGLFRLNPDGSRDETFVGGLSSVYSISLQADGKILVAGGFGVARLNSDGTRDNSFSAQVAHASFSFLPIPIPIPPNPHIAALPDGKSLLYGYFNRVNGVAKEALVRLNNDGSLDNTFNAVFSSGISIASLALQADGKILVGGSFTAISGTPINHIARLNPDGSLDTSFSSFLTIFNDPITNIRVQADGKIFVTGEFPTTRNVVKLNVDGSIDTSFVAHPNARINDILVSENPIIVGVMDQVNGIQRLGIARLDDAGNVDANFAVHLANYASARKIFGLPDGKALIGGDFVRIGNSPTSNLARLNSDGTLDSSFNPAVSLHAIFDFDVKISADSRIGIIGGSNLISTGAYKEVAILNYDGSLDTSFNVNITSGSVNDMAFYRNGKVLFAGSFKLGSETQTFTLAMLNADGTRDTSFTPTFTSGAVGGRVLAQSDGKIYATGGFTSVNGILKRGFVRFNADGSVDQTFNVDLSDFYNAGVSITQMHVQPDGKLLIFGNFSRSSVFGNRTSYLLRLNTDGSLDSSFAAPDVWFFYNGFVVQSDGRILMILNSSNRVIRLKQNGRFDYSFNFHARGALSSPTSTGSIAAIGVQSDNRILVSGLFTIFNETSRINFARLENSMLAPPTDFDFDADGKSDLAVFRPSDTSWHILKSSNNNYSATTFGLPDDKLVPADYDQDGITDFAVFRPSDGVWYILNSLTNQVRTMKFGQSGDIPVPADYNGDNVIDFAVYRPSTGVWWFTNSNWRSWENGTVRAVPFGAAGDIPTIGDFDGDGKSDIAVWRPSTGIWYRLNIYTNQFFAYQLGVEGDKPTPADYDGDSKTDISVYRPSNGTWYRLNSSDNSLTVVHFGLEEDKPVPADYDGDGKADIAVFRPSSGVWYELRSTQGSNAQPFGLSGDLPVQNAFVP
jgi:uncharacterized delta-60 repeat protein